MVIATGVLHDNHIQPEKSLQDISAQQLLEVHTGNFVIPALIIKHFAPLLNDQSPAYLAALSARVGSISDNHLGGWYSYRASKAALNMLIKNTAIEISRRNKQAVIVGLHPGTVASNLSAPFAGHVPPNKLFTKEYAASQLLNVLEGLTPLS